MTQRSVAEAFGPDEAPKVLAIADDLWHGPFISSSGAHFLRVAERHPSRKPEFENARRWLEQDWLINEQRERTDQELEQWRKNYRIQVLTPESDGR